MAAIKRRRLSEPDEVRRFAFGEGHLTRLGTLTIGRALLRAGIDASEAVREFGLQVRVGIHTGEIEVGPTDVRGVAIHATARIMALGGPSEVLVCAVTRSLINTSDIQFEEHGWHVLKGLDRLFEIYHVMPPADGRSRGPTGQRCGTSSTTSCPPGWVVGRPMLREERGI